MQPEAVKILAAQQAPLGGQKNAVSCPTPKIGAPHERESSEGGGQILFHAPPLSYRHETEFLPLAASEFLSESDEAVNWIMDDFLPSGGVAILAGKPKEGKTTLAYELAVNVAKGQPFLGRSTSEGGVLFLALEEHPRDVRMRLRSLGVQASDAVYVHAASIDPTEAMLEKIKQFVIAHTIKLIVVDTLAALWRISDENDAAAVTQAVKPLLALARESGACVLLIHHARKSEGSFGDEIRGSGALFALADVALILKRHEVPTQRKLQGISRYPDTPSELLIELKDSGYVALGDPAAINKKARLEKIRVALGHEPELAEAIVERAGIAKRDGYRLLSALVDRGEAIRTGAGKKGSPFLYCTVSLSCNPPSPCTNGKSTTEVIVDAD